MVAAAQDFRLNEQIMDEPRGDASFLRSDLEVFFISALILYLELLLIRWIGTEIRIFAYLGNLLLIMCFFGVGLGCYRAAKPVQPVLMAAILLLLATLVANPFHIPELDFSRVTFLLSGFEDSPIWWDVHAAGLGFMAGGLLIAILIFLVTLTFAPLGQVLGRAMQRAPHTIRAYSINIAGSLAGVWLFDTLSWASTPPVAWMLVAAALLAATLLAGKFRAGLAVGLVAAAAWVVWSGDLSEGIVLWSPYQKVAIFPIYVPVGFNQVQPGYIVQVNGTAHQAMLDLSDAFTTKYPELFAREQLDRNHYNVPFSFKPNAHRILIVGAGAGNNAAAALRHGVEQVDCVEIDPQIYAVGQRFHPEQPYSSPRVRMIVNDARAFFKQATGPYDMVWYGWLDAHTLGSSYNNMRLDHYVYTAESFREAKKLLAPDGLMVVNFPAQRTWMADRLFSLLRQTFGHDPFVYSEDLFVEKVGHTPTVTLVIGEHPVSPQMIQNPALRDFVISKEMHPAGNVRITTDDWPYLYLQKAGIPRLHLIVSAVIVVAVLLVGRRALGVAGGSDWHFFALGAAFLLLEVQTVSRATLLFGMTWIVNAIVISAVLVMILLSNLVAWRWPRVPQAAIVSGLALSLAALALVPLDWFNALTGATKLFAASAFLTAPVFFAGLIFIRSFAACEDKSRALGSNLIGALAGGLLEALSFVTGVRALILLVALFYLIAIWRRPSGNLTSTIATA
jgi:SAM-dependent methyltransferase